MECCHDDRKCGSIDGIEGIQNRNRSERSCLATLRLFAIGLDFLWRSGILYTLDVR